MGSSMKAVAAARHPTRRSRPRAAEMEIHREFDGDLLRRAFACFPSGVTAFCGMLEGRPVGMAASSFTSVSLEPPLVSVCVRNDSTTWPKLAGLPRLGLSVLAEEQGPVARALAAKDADRFVGTDWLALDGGAVLTPGSTLWLECSLYDEVPAGDHRIVLLTVESLAMNPDVSPMVFHGSAFRTLVSSS